MNILEAVGLITVSIITLILLYKLYRYLFGYSWNSCPNDHDTMTRQGASMCYKCKSSLTDEDYDEEDPS